jgi:phosphoglycolate phosphatase-like HAD superfamily hydrolase
MCPNLGLLFFVTLPGLLHGFLAPISTISFLVTMKLNLSKEVAQIKVENIKGIVFDIDGTLADSWKLGFDATQVILKRHGIPEISKECYHYHCKYATPERLARHAGLNPSDPTFEKVGRELGSEFDELYVGLVNTETAGFYEGMHDLLNSFPDDIVYGALTNACVAYAHAVLKSNSEELYKSRFLSVRGADDVPAPKPAPDGLFQVCKDLSLDPEDCVYVGDSPSDGAAAAAAGMPSIGVLWGSNSRNNLESAPFAHIVTTVDELKAILHSVCMC